MLCPPNILRSDPEFRPYRGVQTCKRKEGYIFEFRPDHPGASKWGWVAQHRLVMESMIGRFLAGTEEVHHVNCDKSDNRPENLLLFPNRGSHQHWHKLHEAKRYDPEIVDLVRRAAEDPHATQEDLGMSHQTVRAICEIHNIEWLKASRKYVPEPLVREALHGRSAAQAAKILGVSLEWFYRNHMDKIQKRNPPGFLDAHREEISSLSKTLSLQELADRYGTNRQTVAKALTKWGVSLDESDTRDKIRRAKRASPRTASGQFCEQHQLDVDHMVS